MDPAKYEYQSDFAKRYVAQGIEQGLEKGIEKGISQGRIEGRAELISRLLTLRFGPLTEAAQTRIQQSSIAELDAIGEQLLTASSLDDAVRERR